MFFHILQEIKKDVRVIVNVTYSYSIVETAAKDVQAREVWLCNEEIKNMKFTSKWVKSFLLRGGVTRRKITREDKVVPSDEEIAAVLRIGQKKLIENEHTARSCYNFDETAFTWAIGPTHVYCPINQARATNIGISNTKLRITAVIAVSAEGNFAPLMLIIKHSVCSEKKPDQTTMTVIRELNKKDGFTINDGWKLKEWSRELIINGVTAMHKVLYIIHEETGHVITSQVKAWNDTVRMILWFEVLIKPIKDSIGKMILWCDNCGSHKTTCVMDVIREIGVDVVFLPKNMTGELQVLDLVVNGPLKAHIRTNRANRLYRSFHEYKAERAINNKLPRVQRKLLDFNPPKPTMLEGIQDLIRLFNEQMTEKNFKECIHRTFVKTGTFPIPSETNTEPSSFVKYKKEQLCGTLSVVPEGTIDICSDDEKEKEEDFDNIEYLERAILEHYAKNNDVVEITDDVDDSDDENDN